MDWGKTEDFSLKGIGQSECDAGVMDIMKADIDSAEQSLIKTEQKDFDLNEIKNSIIFSARALLVIKGVDPKSDKEVLHFPSLPLIYVELLAR